MLNEARSYTLHDDVIQPQNGGEIKTLERAIRDKVFPGAEAYGRGIKFLDKEAATAAFHRLVGGAKNI